MGPLSGRASGGGGAPSGVKGQAAALGEAAAAGEAGWLEAVSVATQSFIAAACTGGEERW